MTGILKRLPGEVSGPQVGQLKRYIPGISARTGLVRRYSAWALPDHLVGTPVRALPDSLGLGADLRKEDPASRRPILRRAGGKQYLEFDGVDDFLYTDLALPQPYTIAYVVRTKTTVTNAFVAQSQLSGNVANVFTNANGALSFNAGKTVAMTEPALGTTLFQFALVTANGPSSRVRVNDTSVVGDAGTSAIGPQIIVPTSASPRGVDLMEILVWDRALSVEEAATTYAELKLGYGL